MSTRASPRISSPGWRHGPALLVAIAFSFPAVVMLLGSLAEPGQPPQRSPIIVSEAPTGAGYQQAFELVDLGRQLMNSLIISLVATPLAVVSASLAGFVIVRASRRVAAALISLAVIGVVVPPAALLVGRFVLYRQVGLLDTWAPLVAPALYGVNSLAVLLFAWSFKRIPHSLFEVAEIEGVSPLVAWRSIAMPLARPMTIAVATIAFAATWSDFLSPLVFLTSEDLSTLPLGLRSLQLVGSQDMPVLLAGCVVATAPVIGVFAVAQRWLFASVRGLT
jgi:multiple sugar transport system permease protein